MLNALQGLVKQGLTNRPFQIVYAYVYMYWLAEMGASDIVDFLVGEDK